MQLNRKITGPLLIDNSIFFLPEKCDVVYILVFAKI